MRRKGGRAAQRGTGTTVLTYPGSAPWGTGKAGENGQNSGDVGGSSAWTRPSAPECGDTLKAPAGDQRPIQGGDRPRRRLRGRYRLGHRPDVLLRTQTAQMYSQAMQGPSVWTLKRCCAKRMGPKKCDSEEECLLQVERCSPRGAQEPDCESRRGARRTQALLTKTTLTLSLEFLMDHIDFVMDLNNNDTDVPEDQLEEHVLQLSAKDFACRSKAKAKPQRKELAASSPRIIHGKKEIGSILNQGNILSPSTRFRRKWFIFFVIVNKYIEEDGAVQFWRIEGIFRVNFHKFHMSLTIDGKHVWQQEEERKGDISIALIILVQFFTSVLFKDILETISLIQRYRTMW